MAEQVTQVLGIVGMSNKGEYSTDAYYEKLNVVSYNGSSYSAKTDVHGIVPTNTDYWQLVASKGDTGSKGETGDTGQDGHTPVKGVDYYTAADKAELESTLASDVTTEVSNQLDDLTSATPLVASSISEMTDTSRIYVLSTDGHWYWYNGSTWVDGGVYQALVEDYDTTLTQNKKIPNSKSIGDKINNNVITKNVFNKNDYKNNYQINSSSVIAPSNDYFITNIISMKNGDSIYSILWEPYNTNAFIAKSISRIAKVNAFGEIQSSFVPSPQTYWEADEDCFIILSIYKGSNPITDYENSYVLSINTPSNKFIPYYYELKENKDDINEISNYRNFFNKNDYSIGSSITSNGDLTPINNYFTTNLIPCKNGDIVYLKYFNNDEDIKIYNVAIYDNSCHFVSRNTVNSKNFTCSHTGFVKLTCINPNGKQDLDNYLTISINEQLGNYLPYKRYVISQNNSQNQVSIDKIDNNNYLITYGDFKVTLFKTDNNSTNAHNWNLKDVTDKIGNILVPTGTDIIGPVKINNNTDFVGGVHGDETTDYITVSINNNSYDLDDITQASGKSLTLIMKSSIYDQYSGTQAFDRYVTLIFTYNKIRIINSYKASTSLTLKIAATGGLIGCKNNIIKDIIFNNSYYSEAPEISVSNSSINNTSATINTIYGSITVNNIKGYENINYTGYLQVYTNETPKRCKVYFMPYKSGNYSISTDDIILGEFEYIFS